MIDLLREAADFLETEAENRSHAGSDYSDYAREPADLAERLRAEIERLERDQPR